LDFTNQISRPLASVIGKNLVIATKRDSMIADLTARFGASFKPSAFAAAA
jgi:hypothetical protein